MKQIALSEIKDDLTRFLRESEAEEIVITVGVSHSRRNVRKSTLKKLWRISCRTIALIS
ncbi:MAG: hypothetical protein L0387_30375 [Acidobacteria bacterium]|nr:hypothetical protein [Acidobacteriota bacterium]